MTKGRAQRIVAAAAFLTISLELVLSRIFHFYLGVAASYSAIPFVLFGLSVGSLLTHCNFRIAKIAPASSIFLFALSFLFSSFLLFYLTRHNLPPLVLSLPMNMHSIAPPMFRVLLFSLLFLVPFVFMGSLFSNLFREHAKNIGNLYFADFMGGTLACITIPVAFHFFTLQTVFGIVCAAMFVAYLLSAESKQKASAGLILLSAATFAFFVTLDTSADISRMFAGKAREIAHHWNEYARNALVELKDSPLGFEHQLMVDDRASNVYLVPYLDYTASDANIDKHWEEYLPKLWDMDVSNVLVIFAGCAKDMIYLDRVFQGNAQITGVEINPALPELCISNPEVKDRYHLQQFLSLPHITLEIAEGRGYLSRIRGKKFDVIFIGAEGTSASDAKLERTGLYLLTENAMRNYVDLLTPGGVVIFGHQTSFYERIPTLRHLHSAISSKGFEKAILIGDTFTVYKPEGFSNAETSKFLSIHQMDEALFVAGNDSSNPVLVQLVSGGFDDKLNVMTDDKPYAFPITWNSFFQERDEDGVIQNLGLWLRNTLMLLLGMCTFVFLLFYQNLLRDTSSSMLSYTAYFFFTGFAYMCLQIGLLSKFTFFLDNPLYTMALIISVFLSSNGLGSYLVQQRSGFVSVSKLLVWSSVITVVTLIVCNLFITHGTSLPLPVKFLVVVISLAPIGIALGAFYPLGVLALQAEKGPSRIPFTYGISTASSIIGACYSLLLVRSFGYNLIILHAVIFYLLLLLIWSRRGAVRSP